MTTTMTVTVTTAMATAMRITITITMILININNKAGGKMFFLPFVRCCWATVVMTMTTHCWSNMNTECHCRCRYHYHSTQTPTQPPICFRFCSSWLKDCANEANETKRKTKKWTTPKQKRDMLTENFAYFLSAAVPSELAALKIIQICIINTFEREILLFYLFLHLPIQDCWCWPRRSIVCRFAEENILIRANTTCNNTN